MRPLLTPLALRVTPQDQPSRVGGSVGRTLVGYSLICRLSWTRDLFSVLSLLKRDGVHAICRCANYKTFVLREVMQSKCQVLVSMNRLSEYNRILVIAPPLPPVCKLPSYTPTCLLLEICLGYMPPVIIPRL